VHIDDVALPDIEAPQEDADNARVFVRPHDIELDNKRNGRPAVAATVRRIYSAGPISRVELALPTGQELTVTVPHDRVAALALVAGSAVFVKLRRARVFA